METLRLRKSSGLGLVVSAFPLSKLDRVSVGVEGSHGALPRFVMWRLMEHNALGLELFVQAVEIVGAELDVNGSLLLGARVLDTLLSRLGHREESDRPRADADHGEGRKSVPLDLEAQLGAVELDRSFDALDRESQTFEAHFLTHVILRFRITSPSPPQRRLLRPSRASGLHLAPSQGASHARRAPCRSRAARDWRA